MSKPKKNLSGVWHLCTILAARTCKHLTVLTDLHELLVVLFLFFDLPFFSFFSYTEQALKQIVMQAAMKKKTAHTHAELLSPKQPITVLRDLNMYSTLPLHLLTG